MRQPSAASRRGQAVSPRGAGDDEARNGQGRRIRRAGSTGSGSAAAWGCRLVAAGRASERDVGGDVDDEVVRAGEHAEEQDG
jgi:hypothetical protein